MSQVSSVDIERNYPQIPTDFIADVGSAIPIANQLEILGETVLAGLTPIYTSASGNTVVVNAQISSAIASTDPLSVGMAAFNSAQFSVNSDGFVSLVGGGTAIDSIAMDVGGPISPTAAGLVTFNGAIGANSTRPIYVDGSVASTARFVVQAAISAAGSVLLNAGMASFNSSEFTVDTNGFVALGTTGAGKTITGDTGGALSPTANNWNILGGPGVTTSGSGSTLTINSVVFTNTTAATLAVDNGYFATAAGTYSLPATAAQGELIIVICDTAGAVVIDAPALNFIRLGNQITAASGNITSSAIGDSVTLRYRLSTLTWYAVSVTGNWTIN